MKSSFPLKRGGFKKVLCAAIVCGVPLALCPRAQARSSYSASNFTYQPNGQTTSSGSPDGNANKHQGIPRYTGTRWTNHLTLEGGAGVTPPAGNTQTFANTGYNVLLGVGYKFNHRLSLLAEWNFNRLAPPSALLSVIPLLPGSYEHLWSADLNPKFNFIQRNRMNIYAIGGGGFSRALIKIAMPTLTPNYSSASFSVGSHAASTSDVTIFRTSSNQANWNVGLGDEWRISAYHRGKIFLEARYEKFLTPYNGLPPGLSATIVPVTLGYRW